MAEAKHLGVHWGRNALYFVELIGNTPSRLFPVTFSEETQGSIEGGPFTPAGMALVSLIQNVVRKQKITAATVNLSLPSKDIIFRSFTLPWMQSHEIKGVVDFEISKYVPFGLDELVYSFHPMSITEGDLRRIRIIFVAIKKTVLGSYTNILEQASLKVSVIEPATVSLIRALVFKGLISKEETIALIEKGPEMGNIVVVDQYLPQFVREFQLRIPVANQQEVDPKATVTRLINEVRISLNYFNRQEENMRVGNVTLITSTSEEDLIGRMEEDLKMPVGSITADSIFKNPEFQDIGFLNAYGVSLMEAVTPFADLNLSATKPKTGKPVVAAQTVRPKSNLKAVLPVTGVCGLIIVVLMFLPNFLIQRKKTEVAALSAQLKTNKNVDTKKIQLENAAIKKKIDRLKGIRTRSDVAALLAVLPSLLPDGIWIDQLEIAYPETLKVEEKPTAKTASRAAKPKPTLLSIPAKEKIIKAKMDVYGYAYVENSNEQFTLINEMIRRFRENPDFAGYFEKADLVNTQAKKIDKYDVTYFQLHCE